MMKKTDAWQKEAESNREYTEYQGGVEGGQRYVRWGKALGTGNHRAEQQKFSKLLGTTCAQRRGSKSLGKKLDFASIRGATCENTFVHVRTGTIKLRTCQR